VSGLGTGPYPSGCGEHASRGLIKPQYVPASGWVTHGWLAVVVNVADNAGSVV
jgi:hypothetical protein